MEPLQCNSFHVFCVETDCQSVRISIRNRILFAIRAEFSCSCADSKELIPFQQAAEDLYKMQALLNEIDGIKKQIDRLNAEIGFFFPDEHKMRARDALKTRIDGLLTQLEEMCTEHA
jgi:hypothetical protein